MQHPTDKIAHTTAFVTPVVDHWLEREIAQWVVSFNMVQIHMISELPALTKSGDVVSLATVGRMFSCAADVTRLISCGADVVRLVSSPVITDSRDSTLIGTSTNIKTCQINESYLLQFNFLKNFS